MLAVIAVYCVLNVVIQSVIQPKFVGDAVGLSVTLTFLSLIFWTWVLGPLGAILAVPLTLMAKAFLVDIDPAYGSGWTGYTWNRDLFPDPEAFLTELHDRGLATSLNVMLDRSSSVARKGPKVPGSARR